jgi:trimeric autotransporter adhesin
MNSMNQSTMRASLVVVLALACFVLPPNAAAVNPPPDGGYPGANTAEGDNALLNLTSGTFNTAVGFASLGSNTEGNLNTAIGAAALVFNTADRNTAIGAAALYSNTTGSFNTATGFLALTNNTGGGGNTANGTNALAFNITGSDNTATGNGALFNNNANSNTANGADALFANTTGSDNTAMGENALRTNISGNFNTAIGSSALSLSTGHANTAVGDNALGNSTDDFNTAVGSSALARNTTGTQNTALGVFAGRALTTGDNNIDIGAGVEGVAGESDTIRIGNGRATATFIRGISGATAAGGAAVFVNSSGHLGTLTSSARFKDEIKPMGNASEAILALRPVSFRYKKEIDPQGIPQFGLVAEEVEKVNPDLVIREANGRPQTVRYEQVNAMLLNEFLKEHRTVNELKATVAQQQKQLEALTAGLQNVSAQLELNKTAPQTVLNDN